MTNQPSTHERRLITPSWDSIVVGQQLGPVDLVVDEHYVRRFAFISEDYQPLLSPRVDAQGRRYAHAISCIPELLRLYNTVYDPNADTGLHQKEEVWITSAALIGENVRLSGKISDKYIKRNKEYIVTESEVRSLADNRLILRHKCIETVGYRPATTILGAQTAEAPERRVAANWIQNKPCAAAISAADEIGTQVRGAVRRIRQDQMSMFSAAYEFIWNMHTDIRIARREGLNRTLAQALMGTVHISELGARIFGEAWSRTGFIRQAYISPIHPGDDLEVRGILVDKLTQDKSVRLEFEVWLEDGNGRKVAVGWMGAAL